VPDRADMWSRRILLIRSRSEQVGGDLLAVRTVGMLGMARLGEKCVWLKKPERIATKNMKAEKCEVEGHRTIARIFSRKRSVFDRACRANEVRHSVVMKSASCVMRSVSFQ
jgi:hypothetical protein